MFTVLQIHVNTLDWSKKVFKRLVMSIQVGLYNMGDRGIDRLRIIFKMVYKDQCVVSEIEHADVVIVNIEKGVRDVVTNFNKSYPEKPVIALSDTPLKIEGTKCLARPYKLPELLEALKQESHEKQASEQSYQSLAASLPKQNGNPHAKKLSVDAKTLSKTKKTSALSEDEIYYNPDRFLQGKLATAIKEARAQKKSVFLRCWAHRWIVISPSSDHLVENIKERRLVSMGLVNTDNDLVFVSEPFTDTQMKRMSETPINEVKVTSVEKFTWNVAVRTARGRIPKGTSLDEQYILKRWPNLTRLSKIANSMRISARWLDRPQSINQIAKTLAIPLEDVFTYFSAATAIEHLKKAERQDDNKCVTKTAEAYQSKKGLFSAFLRKLNILSYGSNTKSRGINKIV